MNLMGYLDQICILIYFNIVQPLVLGFIEKTFFANPSHRFAYPFLAKPSHRFAYLCLDNAEMY